MQLPRVELTVKGDVRVLRVRPGDKILIEFRDRVSGAAMADVRERLQAMFPTNEVVVVAGGLLSVLPADADHPIRPA